MKVVTRMIEGVTVVHMTGRLELGEGSAAVRDVVHDLLAKGRKKILLSLADVEYIDSSGLGALVSAYTSVQKEGGELKMVYLTKKVHDLLQMTKLYTVFDVKEDEAAGIASFSKSAASNA
jgi:anti-sigma B factor antagonist